jgi:SAM-dependent methyltransferase
MNTHTPVDPQLYHLDYSLRRYYVDEFHFRRVPMLPAGSRVLDLGGNKIRKRGQFDIERYPLQVTYANLSTAKRPDVQADAAAAPFGAASFDGVLCSELLEHVPEPLAVLHEIQRTLRPGGVALICVPFMTNIHGDPHDYGRYTDCYWRDNLTRTGFTDLIIEKQGLYWSVLVDMLRTLVYQRMQADQLQPVLMQRLAARLIRYGKRKALDWDARPATQNHPVLGSYTTGFGIVAAKL